MKLAIFVSGSGSLLPGFFKVEKESSDFTIESVVANRQCGGVELAQAAGKEVLVVNQFDEQLLNYLADHMVDTICLAGFLQILPANFVKNFPGKIYNTHPALLPAFGGKGMYGAKVHQAVAEAGAQETGFTVHEVTENIDEGPIVFQKTVPILPTDDWKTIEINVKNIEKDFYPLVIKGLGEGKIMQTP